MEYLYQDTLNVLKLPWFVEPDSGTHTYDISITDSECEVFSSTVEGTTCRGDILFDLQHECGSVTDWKSDIGEYRIALSITGTVYARSWVKLVEQQT